ncbi:putative exporter of the RND superfamily [Methanonatronarchaeum thermophilum]|uniref:Putative exporter of the RND superfamily n=1 Tax=Methanonatronarchaeum thermophilum TaxID=1927129 RepID=A0A1Y3GHU1_9EURY|nr:MMPL family transporter [Methanonatronarchaeum thermophilum]OUJ18956.1 putative exporter of the RND superfamily [Methanonatronarchaeum thermophilum]
MVRKDDITDFIINQRKTVIIVLLIISLIMAVGALNIEMTTDIDEFEVDNKETEKMTYISENMTTANTNDEDIETMQLVFKGDNVLTRDSLENSLQLQKKIQENYAINQSIEKNGITDIANFIPIHTELENKTETLDKKYDELASMTDQLDENMTKLENKTENLNDTTDELKELNEEINNTIDSIEEYKEIKEIKINETTQEPEINFNEPYIEDFVNKITPIINSIITNETTIHQNIDTIELKQQNINNNATQIEKIPENDDNIVNATENITNLSEKLNDVVQKFTDPENRTDENYQLTQEYLDKIEDNNTKINETQDLNNGNDAAVENHTANISDSIDTIESSLDIIKDSGQNVDDSWSEFETAFEEDLDSIKVVEVHNPTLQDLEEEMEELEDYIQIETEFVDGQVVTTVDIDEEGLLSDFENEVREGRITLFNGEVIFYLSDEIPKIVDQSEELEQLNETFSNQLNEAEQLQENLNKTGTQIDKLQEEIDLLEEGIADIHTKSIENQIEIVENMSDDEFYDALESVLDADGDFEEINELLPKDYVEGSLESESRMMIIQVKDNGYLEDLYGFESIEDVQLEIKNIAEEETDEDVLVLSGSLINEEIDRAMEDTLSIIGPLAILLVFGLLIMVYRDFIDILLGMFGIGLIIVWTLGFVGISGIKFNQMFVAVPALMIGLGIDYAIHVFMRYREQREKSSKDVSFLGSILLSIPILRDLFDSEEEEISLSMKTAISAVVFALTLVTITAAIGFLANLTSDIPPVREFGIVNAFGIFSALIIFGAFIPAIKVEVDSYLESKGKNRDLKAFGKGGGFLTKILGYGAKLSREKYTTIVVLAIFLAGVGVVGALQVDTTFEEEDFLPDDDSALVSIFLDEDSYHTKEAVEYINQNFMRAGQNAEILYEGNTTHPQFLLMLNESKELIEESEVTFIRPDGEPEIKSPLTVMQDVKDTNESFNQTYHKADTTGDGIPDTNVTTVYDKLFEVEDDLASEVIHKVGDDYKAALITVSVLGEATDKKITEEMREIASFNYIDDVEVTATGTPIVMYTIQDEVLGTVFEGLAIALIGVIIFLMTFYRYTSGSAILGLITTLPVLLAVAWILGTMYLLDIPFNVITGTITSLTIGLGVAYSIHITERFNIETKERDREVDDAINETVLGTGGALLGSAATTMSGFGVLIFSIIPPLREFGLVAALSIFYAFLASVIVLPSLIKIWSLYVKTENPQELIKKYTKPKKPEKQN